jgi:hypothetical protein
MRPRCVVLRDRERSDNGVAIMTDNPGAPCTRDNQVENIAAELTSAVYTLVLRHGFPVSWLDLELGLWRALAESVKKVGRETSLTLPFASENLMKGTSSRRTLPAKSSAVCGPVTARSGGQRENLLRRIRRRESDPQACDL